MSRNICGKFIFGRTLLPIAAGMMLVYAPETPAQSQASISTRPTFEVASIKLNHSGERPSLGSSPGGRTTAINQTVKSLIRWAYNVQEYQISGGPKWIDSIGYDIDAKPERAANPGPGNIDYFRQMLQALLEDRFQLNLQHTAKEVTVYALVIGKDGPKLKDVGEPANPTDMRMRGGRGLMTGQRVMMGLVAQSLASVLGRPVEDKTSLKGFYDFKLEWTPDETVSTPPDRSSRDETSPSIFTALQEQLGLKLEARKGPVEVLVVEHVENPSGN